MGKRRIRNLRRCGVDDIVGFDVDPKRCADVTAAYSVPTVSSFDAGMARKPQALVISTPPNMHAEFALAGAKAGAHVFTEAGTSTDGLLDVAQLARSANVVAAASCTMRYQPSIKKMKQLVAEGRIGRVLSYTHHCGQWLPDWHPYEDYRTFYASRRETGACREIVPFELTWLNWLVECPATCVVAMKSKLSRLDCDIDDIYQLLIQYGTGTLGHLQVDVLARAPVRHTRLLGEEGTLEWSLTDKELRLYEIRSGKWSMLTEEAPKIENGYSEMSNEFMYDEEIAAYVAAVRGERAWGNTFEDEHRTLSLLLAAEASDASGKRVDVS
jgi:predicted dehydrogenase